MEIRDKLDDIKIKFALLRKIEGNPVFLDINIEFHSFGGVLRDVIRVERSDFEEMRKNAIRLNESLKFGFYFQHLDSRIEIKFSPEINGDINVKGFFKSKNYSETLNFSFVMPPSSLNNIIDGSMIFLADT